LINLKCTTRCFSWSNRYKEGISLAGSCRPKGETSEKDHIHRQRCQAFVLRRSRDAASVVSPGSAGADRHQIQMPQRAVRDLHRACGRRGGTQLHHPDEEPGREKNPYYRGAERRGGTSAAEGLEEVQSAAVRLLPERAVDAGCGAARKKSAADRQGD